MHPLRMKRRRRSRLLNCKLQSLREEVNLLMKRLQLLLGKTLRGLLLGQLILKHMIMMRKTTFMNKQLSPLLQTTLKLRIQSRMNLCIINPFMSLLKKNLPKNPLRRHLQKKLPQNMLQLNPKRKLLLPTNFKKK